MSHMRLLAQLCSLGVLVGFPLIVSAQNFPVKPIRIVTNGTGGSGDVASRQIATELAAALGQPVIIDNRGGTVIPTDVVSKSSPDGYSLLMAGSGTWIGPLLQNVSWDPLRDFAPITITSTQPNIVVVPLSSPANSIKDLIALAKAKPGALNYASGSNGASNHLAAELFKAMADVNIVRIAYKNPAVGVTDLISGQVQVQFGNAGTVGPHVKSGKLRALAVTSAKPSELFPGMPTVAASGVPGYESVGMTGLFAPAKTPTAIINRLNREILRVLNMPEVRQRFLTYGVDPVGNSPEQFAATLRNELTKWGKVIKEAGIRAE